MTIGQYNQPVKIKEATRVDTDSGGYTETFAERATVWAQIEWDTGREYVQASQLNADAEGKLKCRYAPWITADMKVEHHDGRLFDIVGQPVNILERNRETQLLIRERTDK